MAIYSWDLSFGAFDNSPSISQYHLGFNSSTISSIVTFLGVDCSSARVDCHFSNFFLWYSTESLALSICISFDGFISSVFDFVKWAISSSLVAKHSFPNAKYSISFFTNSHPLTQLGFAILYQHPLPPPSFCAANARNNSGLYSGMNALPLLILQSSGSIVALSLKCA